MQQQEFPFIEVKEFKAFAVWRWKSEELNQNCTICKKLMTEPCNECEVIDQQENQQDCVIVQSSNCGHAFHKHCISKWIQTTGKGSNHGTCPLCQLTWEINNEVVVEK